MGTYWWSIPARYFLAGEVRHQSHSWCNKEIHESCETPAQQTSLWHLVEMGACPQGVPISGPLLFFGHPPSGRDAKLPFYPQISLKSHLKQYFFFHPPILLLLQWHRGWHGDGSCSPHCATAGQASVAWAGAGCDPPCSQL